MKNLVFTILSFCIALSAAAKTGVSTGLDACLSKAGGVTSEMSECIAADEKIQDMRLNRAYKELMGQKNSVPRKRKIQEAQRLWLKFRIANCESYADSGGGTMEDIAVRECYRASTEQRAAELESLK